MLEKTDRTVVPPHLRMCKFATQTHELPKGRGCSGTAKAAAGVGAGAMWAVKRRGHAEIPNMEAQQLLSGRKLELNRRVVRQQPQRKGLVRT